MMYTNIFGYLLILGTVNTVIAQTPPPTPTVPLADQCRSTIGFVGASNFIRNQTAVSAFFNTLWVPGAAGIADCTHIENFKKDLMDWTDFIRRCVEPEKREIADTLYHFLDVATQFICKDKKEQFTAFVNSPEHLRCWIEQIEQVPTECNLQSDITFGGDQTFELLKTNGPISPTIDVFPEFVRSTPVSTAFNDYQRCFVLLLTDCSKPLGDLIDSLLNEVKGSTQPWAPSSEQPSEQPSTHSPGPVSNAPPSFSYVNVLLLAMAAPALWGLA